MESQFWISVRLYGLAVCIPCKYFLDVFSLYILPCRELTTYAYGEAGHSEKFSDTQAKNISTASLQPRKYQLTLYLDIC